MYNVESIADQILGTDARLDDVVGSHLLENDEFIWALRDHAIRCQCCLTWKPPHEVDENDECEDCI